MQTVPLSLWDDYVCRRMQEQRADAAARRRQLRLKRLLKRP